MVRIAYFGTDGCPGHYAIPIRGKFTEEDIKVIESVDCDDFYKVFDVMRFKIAEFKGWTILGIPASLDDRGMTFEQALERLKLGRKIKRIDWGKKYICMFDVNILMVDTGQKVASNWNPTEHDIMSNDWEIAG